MLRYSSAEYAAPLWSQRKCWSDRAWLFRHPNILFSRALGGVNRRVILGTAIQNQSEIRAHLPDVHVIVNIVVMQQRRCADLCRVCDLTGQPSNQHHVGYPN